MANAWGNVWGGDTGAWLTAWGEDSATSVVACTSATGTKLSEFVPAEDTSGVFVGATYTSAFTTFNSGSTASISGVCLRLYKEGTPTGTFKVSIRASTSSGEVVLYKPTGADLAVTSAYDMSTVTGGGESFAADYWFALPFTPSSNTFYTIVVEEQGDFVGDSSNTIALVIDGEPENATNGGYSTNYGTSWGRYSTADGGHKVYGTFSTPTLSSPTDAASGATGYNGTVVTDVGAGTLYWVVTQSATSPSATQVQAGQDHLSAAADASSNRGVSSVGVESVSGSGLTAETTYYIHYNHVYNSTESNVASGDGFTTGAPTTAFPSAIRIGISIGL